jgi:SHS2 domain-containing protein
MTYRFLDNVAIGDIACEVIAATLDRLFWDAAEALLKIQIENPNAVRSTITKTTRLTDAQLDLLLYRFLQELIYWKDAERLAVRPTQVVVESARRPFELQAEFQGEKINPVRHRLVTDVKAATLHGLSVQQTSPGWKAVFILDI